MAKFKVLKKIAALTTAIALVVCFAVSASAAQVTTKTAYYGNDKVKVDVDVQAIGDGVDNVTYYAATNEDGIFYIDQKAVIDGSVNFSFAVDKKYLDSEVDIGFSGLVDPGTSSIDGNKVSIAGGATQILPNEEQNPTVTFEYVCDDGFTVDLDKVKVVSGSASLTAKDYTDSSLTVTLSGVIGDIVLDVPQKATSLPTATAEYIDGAGIVVTNPAVKDEVATGENVDDANADSIGDRKLTVVGKVNASAEDYGILVSENAFSSGVYSETNFNNAFGTGVKYQALHKRESGDNAGMFAVQLIDTSVETEGSEEVFVKSNTEYFVAIYVKDSSVGYVLSDIETITVE